MMVWETEKRNIIALAKHHRKTCDGESCNISLWLVKRMATRAGIIFTEEEEKEFV